MKISYRTRNVRGIVPIFKSCTLDSAELNPARAQELIGLVQASGVLGVASGEVRPPGGDEASTWELAVDNDGVVNKLRLVRTASEPCTAALQRLLSFLGEYLEPDEPG